MGGWWCKGQRPMTTDSCGGAGVWDVIGLIGRANLGSQRPQRWGSIIRV